jgi:hypothetical protein
VLFYHQQGQAGRRNDTSADIDPYHSNSVLLIPFEGTHGATSFTDLSLSPATLTGVNSPTISTAVFANGALLLNGTDQRVTTSRNCNIGAGSFTFEMYVRMISLPAVAAILITTQASTGDSVAHVVALPAGALQFYLRNAAGTSVSFTTSNGIVSAGTEYHIRATRNGTTRIELWLDGSSVGSFGTVAGDVPISISASPYIMGFHPNAVDYFANCYMRWVRVTEGVCRNTASFTPPAIPYPRSA